MAMFLSQNFQLNGWIMFARDFRAVLLWLARSFMVIFGCYYNVLSSDASVSPNGQTDGAVGCLFQVF